MTRELRDGFVDEMRGYAEHLQAFIIRLSLKHYPDEIDVEEQNHIMKGIIKPLFQGVKKIILYNDGENFHYGESVTKAIRKKGQLFELPLDIDLFNNDFLPFWSSLDKKRSSILLENNLSNVDFRSLFKNTFDPYVLRNMGTVYPKSSIKRAKTKTEENEGLVFLALAGSDGLTNLAILMSQDKIGEYVQMAIELCKLSQSYLLLYGKKFS